MLILITLFIAEWLDESCFDKIVGIEIKSKERRRKLLKALLDRLVNQERVVVSYKRGIGLARLTELVSKYKIIIKI